jgi:hypothetical protein
MSSTAFISYASGDEAIADRVCAYLEGNKTPCWIASRDVRPGTDYAAEIIGAIESSSVMVLLLSEKANTSVFVKREVERAVSKGKPIFSVRIEDVKPSKALELFISSAEWVDAWQPPLEEHLHRLAESIQSSALASATGADRPDIRRSEPTALPPDVSTSRAPNDDGRKRPVAPFAIVVAAMVVVAVLGWIVFSRSEPSSPLARGAQPASASSAGPCPATLAVNRELATPFTCTCGDQSGSSAAVWGTDFYTDDSALCRAAVHAGVIQLQGGPITVRRIEGRPLYIGTTRNGVMSNDYGSYATSIAFNGAAPAPDGPTLCPGTISINRALAMPFTCRCTSASTGSGAVWGTDVYTEDSSICRAAVHAGVITPGGGTVTLTRDDGRPLYVGTIRNGVMSNDYGAYPTSITFNGTAPPPDGPMLCPSTISINRALAMPFTCRCTSGSTSDGAVWGTDVYTDDSSVCRAAVHAGVITTSGGTVTVTRGDGRSAYVGSTRNGVMSNEYGSYPVSLSFRR